MPTENHPDMPLSGRVRAVEPVPSAKPRRQLDLGLLRDAQAVQLLARRSRTRCLGR